MALPNHALQTDPYLHEPKGITTASLGDVYIADGAGSGSWTTISSITPTGSVIGSSRTMVQTTITGATAVPYDNTKPQLTEGNLCMTGSITPSSVTSILEFDVDLQASLSTTGYVTGALFIGASADSLAAKAVPIITANNAVPLSFCYEMVAGATSELTFTVMAGGSTTGDFSLNGQSATGMFDGVATSMLRIKEIKA